MKHHVLHLGMNDLTSYHWKVHQKNKVSFVVHNGSAICLLGYEKLSKACHVETCAVSVSCTLFCTCQKTYHNAAGLSFAHPNQIVEVAGLL